VFGDPNSDAFKAWTASLEAIAAQPDGYQLDDRMRGLLVSDELVDADRVLDVTVKQARNTQR
jgi:hypothetical protein